MDKRLKRAATSSPVRCPSTKIYDYDEVFRWIVRFKQEHDGNSPTMREIQMQFKISNTSVVSYILKRLERRGRIRLAGERRSRQIYVIGGSWCLQIAPRAEVQ